VNSSFEGGNSSFEGGKNMYSSTIKFI
jgi:hypothetical protein